MIQRYPFFKSIRAKASLLFFAVFLVVLVPVNYIIYSEVTATLAEANLRELKFEAEKIMGQVRLDPLLIPLPSPGYSLKLQYYQDPFFEEIFTSPGFPPLAREAYLVETVDYDTLRIVNLAQSQEGSSIVLSLARSNTRLLDQIGHMQAYLFAASVGSILIAGLLVFLSAGVLLTPINRIIAVARRINASNSIERVPEPRSEDESRELAQTLNDMLARMETSINNQINFFASATHELKTPLAVMGTELSVSLEKIRDADMRKILESQRLEVQRLDRVISDFLLMSQLKSESLSLRMKSERLDEVIYAAMKKVKYIGQERHTQLQVTLDQDNRETVAMLDFDKMQTVFSNLIENAVKYSPEHSTVRIAIGNTCVTVVNTVVQPVADPAALIGEFYKSEELSSGLGMGLWLSHQIVKLHGATLTLSQEGPDFKAAVCFQSVQ